MKILFNNSPCAMSFIKQGLAKVFAAIGHQVVFWDLQTKPAFDMFSEFEPDIYFGTTFDTNRAIAKCIAARPQMKVALYASAWGNLVDKINLKEYPIVAINDNEKFLFDKLKSETGKPDLVYLHLTDKYLEPVLGGWRSIGIEPFGLLNAADLYDYYNGVFDPTLACDIGYVGGEWGYKGKNINKYMLPICDQNFEHRWKIRIFGNQGWTNYYQYAGLIETPNVKNLFASAKVCPNFSEPHSTSFHFDIVERVFKIPTANGFLISDYVGSIEDIFKDSVPFFRTTQEFVELCKYYIEYPEARLPYMEKAKKIVLEGHTYHDRAYQILNKLGYPAEAEKAIQLKQGIINA